MLTLYYIFAGVLGAIIGSFLNVVIYRLPREQTLMGRSKCPRCRTTLGPLDLFPVLSFIALRARCRKCNAPISFRYPFIELLTAGLFILTLYVVGAGTTLEWLSLLRGWFIVSVFIVVFCIDLDHYLILDTVVYRAALVLLACNIVIDTLSGPGFSSGGLTSHGLWGAGIGLGFLGAVWLISRGKWMGLGDVKFMLFFGQVGGVIGTVGGLLFAFYLGAIVAIPLVLFKRKAFKSMLPFGTFLSVAGLGMFFWGSSLWAGYLRLLGW
jgi:prepilin signal peptidase PulO-like enzyme (type II secretory pathway)